MKEIKTIGWLDQLTKSDRRVKWVLILGILGIVLLLLSEFWPTGDKEQTQESQTYQEITTNEYVQVLEERLYDLVSNIQGAGKTKIMVTLDGSGETVYATEGKTNSNVVQADTGDTQKLSESSEESYILVEGKDGTKQALVSKQLDPPVKGVVIVCEGAQDPVVQDRILQAVTTALGISSSKVCITQIRS